MAITEIPAEAKTIARAALQARRRRELDELDYWRELRRLSAFALSQHEIARLVRVAQPTVRKSLQVAARVAMPLDGFSGSTPKEICQRFEAGFIDRARLVDELSRFPYVPGGQTDGYDSLIIDPPGAWSEVSDAAADGVIDDAIYEEVFTRRHGMSASA